MIFNVEVKVTLKPTVMDAQGTTIERALKKLGHDGVTNVRIGKYITMQVETGSENEAKAAAKVMCEELLANQIIEEFAVEVIK